MTLEQALNFAHRSAFVALDTGDVADHRDNVIDFLGDEGASEFVAEAVNLFDQITTK